MAVFPFMLTSGHGCTCWQSPCAELQDPHGAMLLMLVDTLALLGLCLDSDHDMQCCKNCGIMAFIGGALDRQGIQPCQQTLNLEARKLNDLSIAVESYSKARTVEFSLTATPHIWIFLLSHLGFAAAEIAWAALCYVVCSRIEDQAISVSEEVYLATQEEARIYGAALQWSERRGGIASPTSVIKEVAEAYPGNPQKLP
eukprot:s2200_g10.t1